MKEMTAGNLRSAYGGESMAHMRYLAWADKAEKEKLPNVARLFRAVSFAEQVHATNHFTVMKDVAGGFAVTAGGGFGLGSTSENLKGAIEGEVFEIEEMYPAYLKVAELQEEKHAVRSMNWALEAEKTHAEFYHKAKEAVDSGKDADLGAVSVCDTCGYTHTGDPLERCPVCQSLWKRFKVFA